MTKDEYANLRVWVPVWFPVVYSRHYKSRSGLDMAILIEIIGASGECTLIPGNTETVKSVRRSYKLLSQMTNSSKSAVGRAIRKLLKNQLIIREKDSIGYLYKPNMETLSQLVKECLNEQAT